MQISQILKTGGIFVGGAIAAAITLGHQQMLGANVLQSDEISASTAQSLSIEPRYETDLFWISEDMKYGLSLAPYSQDEQGQHFILTNIHDVPLMAFYALPEGRDDSERILYEELLWPEESTLITFDNDWQDCSYDFVVFHTDMTESEDYEVNVCY